MKIYWINGFESGNLGMMTRPRGNDWLEDEVKKMRLYGVDAVVSLLEKSEVNELELQDQDELCFNHGIDLIQFPIEDRNVPEDNLSFVSLIRKIEKRLLDNKKVVIHCRMGIGRTSMVAAGVLIRNGGEVDDVFRQLSKTRTLEVPDTEEQVQWVAAQVKELRKGKEKSNAVMIETERLILRKHTLEDVEPSYQMNLDERVSQFTGDGGVQSREEIHKRIKEDVLGDYEKYGYGRLAVVLKSTGKFIGFAGLKYLDDMDVVDLGYRLIYDQWGKGLATEACKPLVQYGFETLKLNQIIAMVLPENKGSIRVLEKVGFEFEKMITTEGLEAAYYVNRIK